MVADINYPEGSGDLQHECPEWDYMPISMSMPESFACRCFVHRSKGSRKDPILSKRKRIARRQRRKLAAFLKGLS